MYIEQTKEKIMEALKMFLQHEQGNRVTLFNIAGLMNRIEGILKECEEKPEKED